MPSGLTIDSEAIALIEASLTLPEPDREGWLLDRCRDNPELASRTNHLLKLLNASQGGFLATGGASGLSLPQDPGVFDVPDQVGAYQILSSIGQGGMGVVYRGQRIDGAFDRQVAIKFIHPMLLDPTSLARFSVERQALAKLQHPNIAQLLDGGDVNGRPYLVMEYLEGQPLQALPTVRETVTQFLLLCDAVGFAHNNGILHRDLKPANVLVTGEQQLKLLDFGVAKIADQLSTADDLTSTVMLAPLTRNYAAPERLNGDPATASSDQYSLGVMLHELVAGEKPYDLGGLSVSEALSKLSEAGSKTLVTDDDLSLIVARARHVDPERRYATVAAFTDDLNRWLQGLPIAARGDDTGYLLRKFVARNRIAVAVASASMVVVFAALVAVVWAFVQADAQRAVAQTEAANAEGAVEFIKTALSAASPNSGVKINASVADALEYATNNLSQEFGDNPDNQVFLLNALGEIYNTRAETDKARVVTARALAIVDEHFDSTYPRLPMTLLVDGYADLLEGLFADAAGKFERAVGLLESQGTVAASRLPRHQTVLSLAWHLNGQALMELDRLNEAELAFQRCLQIRLAAQPLDPIAVARAYHGLSTVPQRRRDYLAAEPLMSKAVEYQRLAPDFETLSSYFMALGSYGVVLTNLQRYDAAETALSEGVSGIKRIFGEQHPQHIFALVSHAVLYEKQGRSAEAIALLEPLAKVVGAGGTLSVAEAYLFTRLGQLLCSNQRSEDGYDYALAGYQARVTHYSADHVLALDSQANVGSCLAAQSQFGEAERYLLEVHQRLSTVRGEAFADKMIHPKLVVLYEQMGNLKQAQKYREGSSSL